jgi:hypothetical protein
MSVKISQLNNDVTVATLISSGGTLPVVASNISTGNLTTYGVSLTNLKSFITTGDITYTGNVTVQGTLFAPNQTTVSLTSVSSTSNLIEVQTDANLTLPNVIVANNKSVGVRIYYVANATADVSALILNATTNYLTWFGSNVGNANGVISANSILGTFAAGDLVAGNNTSSNSSVTGALRVTGGAGIGGNIYAAGDIITQANIGGNTITTDSSIVNLSITSPIATISNYITADKLIVNTTSILTGNVTTLAEIAPVSNASGSLGNTTNYYGNLFAANGFINVFLLSGNNFIPRAANVSNIGNSSNWFSNGHITTLNTILVNASNVSAGNVLGTVISSNIRAGILSANGNITANNLNANNSVVATTGEFSAIIKTGANAVGNIGQIDNRFNTIHARATSAAYADLAEIYIPDSVYEAGTVVVFGGEKEITTTDTIADTRVAGAISTNPAYLMNGDEQGLPLALRGKVPVNVIGPVDKGDLLVTSNIHGYATSVNNVTSIYDPNAVFAKSLEKSEQSGPHKIWAMIL